MARFRKMISGKVVESTSLSSPSAQSQDKQRRSPTDSESQQGYDRGESGKDTRTSDEALLTNAKPQERNNHKRRASQSLSAVEHRHVLPLRHKRSRLTPTPSPTAAHPPSATSVLTNTSPQPPKKPFNLFSSLLKHPELVLAFASGLPIPDLLSLYAISKPFHYLLNSHHTTYILASARRWAPDAAALFPFKAYAPLCIVDPVRRANSERPRESRLVPGFKWLQMAAYRARVASQIVALLALDGHRLPGRAKAVLMKIWFMMDVSSNGGRIGLVHNEGYWTNEDLEVATMLFVKLDMRFMDPVDGFGETGMRRLLLGQRSLTTLWRVLRREELRTHLELLQMYVRYSWRSKNPAHAGMSVLGVPANEVGRGCLEGWGKGSQKLLTPDELVMREAVKRRLRLQDNYLDYMLWGYVDDKTLEDVPVPTVEGIMTGQRDGANNSRERHSPG